MQLSKYVKIYPYPDKPGYLLLFAARRGAITLVRESLLDEIRAGTLAGPDRDALARLGFLVADPVAEREELRNLFRNSGSWRKFTAMVILNLDCNLACTYCYEGGMKGKRYMSPLTADLLVQYLQQEHISHGRNISLQFYGGEPLLSTDLISLISSRVKEATEAKGQTFSFSLVTNGTLLTGKMVERLIPLGLTGAKVTLDGPRHIHDKFRPMVSGKGSFDLIVENVKSVCGLITIQLGGNYTIDNYREFPALLDHLLAEGITPDKLALVKFDPVSKTTGDQVPPEFNDGCASVNEPWLTDAGLFLREEILKRGFAAPKMLASACMIESENKLVVHYDGSLYKCPGFIGHKWLSVGDLASGIKDYHESHGLDIWKTDECLDCAYLPLCFGGCRLLRLLQAGKIDGVECNKRFLDATLEGFLKQDLKYRSKK